MFLPRLIYGTWKEVKPRISKMITQLKRGATLPEAIGADDLLDTEAHPGLVVIDGPSIYGGPHFHCFGPLRLIEAAIFKGRLPRNMQEPIFIASLQSPWGAVGLLGTNDGGWLVPAGRLVPALRAWARFWDILASVGPRYTFGSTLSEPLWKLPSNIKYVLANLGVPESDRHAPLPPGGLAELAARHHLLDLQ